MEAFNSLAIRVLNHLIQSESWAQIRLIVHSGAKVHIDSGLFVLNLAIDEQGFFRKGNEALEPDVSITLPSDLAIRLIFDRGTLFSSVKLGGSADIAESLAFVMRNLRWDAEADLAQLVGDIPARRMARFAQSMALAIQQAVNRAADNLSEYAVEESGILTAIRNVTEFGIAVNRLRDDVARLEKRVSRL